jgi:excisionase family DNA binding protein
MSREGNSFPIVEVKAMEHPMEERTGRGRSDSLTSQLLLTAEQAAATLAICRTKVYDLLRKGQLESVQIGTSRRIPYVALTKYMQNLRDDRSAT